VENGGLVPADSLRLMTAAGVADPLSLVNPYRFGKPLAPSVAAELEGKDVNVGRIMKAYAALSRRHDFMIVEGAGGIMVPLSDKALLLDLAGSLGLPVLIVARPGLGTINHTLLTVEALRNREIPIAGIIMNHSTDAKPGLSEKTNPAVIERMSGVRITAVIPHGSRDFVSLAHSLRK
jgi:dethiobiotin synthetase